MDKLSPIEKALRPIAKRLALHMNRRFGLSGPGCPSMIWDFHDPAVPAGFEKDTLSRLGARYITVREHAECNAMVFLDENMNNLFEVEIAEDFHDLYCSECHRSKK